MSARRVKPRARAVAFAAACTALLLAALATAPARADDSEPGDRLTNPRPPAGFRIVEGDILIPESEVGKPNPGRYSTFQPDKLWPGGVVPYAFDTSVTNNPGRQMAIQNAMAMVAAAKYGSMITFVPRTNQSDYVYYIDGGGNFSPVGRQGGRQEIHVVSWSNTIVICHETMHSLGFWHEQSRSDRNTYVTIHNENVCTNCCNGGDCTHNFDMESGSSNYGPYDFDSVMHYGKCDFLRTGLFCAPPNLTIVVNPPYASQWQDAIGQRNHLSRMDLVTLSFLYAQNNWRFVDANGSFGNGTFLDPYSGFTDGATGTPSGGQLFIQPGNYQVTLQHSFSTPMTIVAPIGPVTITRGPSLARATNAAPRR